MELIKYGLYSSKSLTNFVKNVKQISEYAVPLSLELEFERSLAVI